MLISFTEKRHIRDAGRVLETFFGKKVNIQSGRSPAKIADYCIKGNIFAEKGLRPELKVGV